MKKVQEKVLKKCIQEGIIKSEDIFITSKIQGLNILNTVSIPNLKNNESNEFSIFQKVTRSQYDHYNRVILRILNNIKKLVSGSNYFNDGRIKNYKILLIENLSQSILNNNPYIGVYSRLNE